MLEKHFLLENLSISEPSLGILKKINCSLSLPNTKYNCVVLFLSSLYFLKLYLVIDHYCKALRELTDVFKNSPNILNFLKDVILFLPVLYSLVRVV